MPTTSDRIGRKPILQLAAIAYVLLTFPAFALLTAQPTLALLTAVQAGFAVLLAMYGGPLVAVLAELFPTRSRATAVALAYNLTAAVIGGSAPFIVIWLVATTGDPRAPALYVTGAAIISGVAPSWLRDRYLEPLR
jgi:MFS transporter, MHS family, proline/betaine transporter